MRVIGKKLTLQTLIGPSKGYPVKRGNCFSIECDDGKEYRIVNFNVENYEKCIELGVDNIHIKPLSDKIAIIHDERIPENWYDEKYCTTCCPFDLLPEPQKMEYERKDFRGEITRYDDTNMISEIIHSPLSLGDVYPEFKEYIKPRKLSQEWTVELEETLNIAGDSSDIPDYILAPYIPIVKPPND